MQRLTNKRVYFDVNIFIYALEPTEDNQLYFQSVTHLFNIADNEQILAMTSELSLAEALVGAYKYKPVLVQLYEAMISPRKGFAIHTITRDILKTAAELRSNQVIALADAIHVASAIHHQANFFITQDKRLQTPACLTKVMLEQLQYP